VAGSCAAALLLQDKTMTHYITAVPTVLWQRRSPLGITNGRNNGDIALWDEEPSDLILTGVACMEKHCTPAGWIYAFQAAPKN
jgi:hypothetical protein